MTSLHDILPHPLFYKDSPVPIPERLPSALEQTLSGTPPPPTARSQPWCRRRQPSVTGWWRRGCVEAGGRWPQAAPQAAELGPPVAARRSGEHLPWPATRLANGAGLRAPRCCFQSAPGGHLHMTNDGETGHRQQPNNTVIGVWVRHWNTRTRTH